jgi:glucose/arabinose dehydrogenase
MKIKLLVLCTMVAMASISCKKDTDGGGTTPLPDVELKSKVLLSGLILPWEILYGPDNMIWMTEKGGKISRVNPSNGQITPVLTIGDVIVKGEGGLLGMVLHPDFNTTPYVYVVYGYGNPYKNKVVRYTYGNNTLASPQVLLDQIPASSIHNGSRLLINGDKLFITTGDAADQTLPQNDNSLAGKILRINLDGSIPSDNPIANNAMWTKGHRNPQGLVMVGNKLFSAEHGPDVEDEVNIIEKGKNYGWPNIKTDIVAPIISWTPTIAPSGLTYYNSDYIPQFKNSLLVAILKDSKIVQLKLDDAQTKVQSSKDFYVKEYGRLRDFAISPEGKIYVCTSNGSDDKIVEISK